ncbi:tRNA preQ1(34) S-adenosylmethionine ribosyltransferase-isomerase QueA [Candidatus Peregrinibacteria bacterium]|nr:tRNA preQ1(34) S-adenosylmethionine ribosyltransferase-isomerase QueA [Candidatus Peregrinibacteria bacterium]
METLEKLLGEYDYTLPKELIAQKPAAPRDGAKLLIYDRKTGKTQVDTFSNLTKYLPKNAVVVFNETKVIPARLFLKKETGGRVGILFIEKVGELIKVLADRKLNPCAKLTLTSKIFFTVADSGDKFYFLKPSFKISELPTVLGKYGKTPIPPYIKNSPLSENQLREQYQTIFAHKPGSVAAPTASLHFTKRLLSKMKRADIAAQFVTLHVNLGTFAPLTEKALADGKLHKEFYEISPKTADFLNKAKASGRPIVAVGTTVVRTLESAADQNSKLEKLAGTTSLFIRENYKPKFVDGLITNFHVPRSSLLMLVSAFCGREKLFELYKKAQSENFRFFSFGDGMLVI